MVSIPEDASQPPKRCESATTSQHSRKTPSTLPGDVDDAKSLHMCHPLLLNSLYSLSSPWPFAMWGMDILKPLPKAPRVVKYLLVTIDYFTKWIEARPLLEITTSKVEKFTQKHLIYRFSLPYAIVMYNDTQFKAQTYEDFLTRLGINHLVTSVEHPQTNQLGRGG